MSQTNEQGSGKWTQSWRQDLLASLVVFLVALPLCMGIALASGAPVAAGLATGIIGGLIVGFLAGAPLQVSGPAAGLTVVCGEVIRQHGLPAFGIVVMIAGALQFAAGILKWGQWFRAVSPAVIHGMLSGIGVLILSSQIHVMVDDRPRHNGLANIISIPEAIWKGLPVPSLGQAESRETKIELLRAFGQLHERQGEVETAVARVATEGGSQALHDQEAKQLEAYVEDQQRLLTDLAALETKFENSAVATGNREESVRAEIRQTKLAMGSALADLKDHRLSQVEQTQAKSSKALQGVLNSLKSHDWAAKVGLLSILIIIGWATFSKGSLKLIPGPLLAVLVVTFAAWFFALPVLYVEIPERFLNGLTFFSWTAILDMSVFDLAIAGMMMAAIASAETLLCASAIDRMHSGPRTQYDRELAAQGIGNFLCGLVGALPMTGVIVRSATNVQAGAKSRTSAILHGLWLLVFVAALSPVLRMIPTSALAGILVYTGFKLIDWKGFIRLWKESRSEALIFLVTVIVIVVEDLLIGVVTGIVLSAIKLLVTFSHLDVRLTPMGEQAGDRRSKLTMTGAATFLRLPRLATALEEVPKGTELHVDLEQLDYIDHACLELLMSWAKQHESFGGRLVIDWGRLHGRFKGDRINGKPGSANGSALGDTPYDSEREPLEPQSRTQ